MSSNEDTFVSGHRAILDKLKFVSHTPPDIVKRPHIVGLCAVPMELASPSFLSHHVSDFLSWKMTFNREGNRDDQAWFSLVDIAGAMSAHKTRYTKVINGQLKDLSGALPFIRVDGAIPSLFAAFVAELDAQAKVAQQKGDCLIVIICGEVSPELDICLDVYDNTKYLSKESWLGSVVKNYSIPITIITPAIFTTGWEIRPFVGNAKQADGLSDEVLDSLLAKQCGGAFATSVLKFWTQEQEASRMIPTTQGPGGQLYSQLYTGIHDCMIRNMIPLAKDHSFHFVAGQDEWEMTLGKRKGPLSLDYFAKKWDDVKNLDESSLAALDGGYKFLAGAFGGSHQSQLVHLNFLVRQELRGCPGEWAQTTSDRCLVAFTSFLQTTFPTEARAREIFTLLEWRCAMNFVADVIVDFFVLPRPQGKLCRYWDWKEQQKLDQEVPSVGNFRMALFGMMIPHWPKIPLPVGQQRDSFHDQLYWRPLQYITSAVTTKYYNPRASGPSKSETEEAKEFTLNGIGRFIDRLSKIQRWTVTSNTQLIGVYDKWLATGPGPASKPDNTVGRPMAAHSSCDPMDIDSTGNRDGARAEKLAPFVASPRPVQQRQRPAAAGMPATAPPVAPKSPGTASGTMASQALSQQTLAPTATVPSVPSRKGSPAMSPVATPFVPAQNQIPVATLSPTLSNAPQSTPTMTSSPNATAAQQNTPAAIAEPATTAAPVDNEKSAVTPGGNHESKSGNPALEAISATLAGLDSSALQSLISLLTLQAQSREAKPSTSGASGYELSPSPSQAANTAPRVLPQPPRPVDLHDGRDGRDDRAVSQPAHGTNSHSDLGGQQAVPTTSPTRRPPPPSAPEATPGASSAPNGHSQQPTEQRAQVPAHRNTQAVPSAKQPPPWENPEIEAMIRRQEAYKAKMAANCKW
ncbi:hypothetical protein RB595_009950 [Gaeumannomyces hyphopodioides]